MSNQYNNAGRSLLVDEVIELKGGKKNTVQEFRQQLDAQLIKRDTKAILGQLEQIGADNYITASEKSVLAREASVISANHPVLVAKAESYGISDQDVFLEYLAAYQELTANLEDILADMATGTEITSFDSLMALFSEYYRLSSLVEEQIFRYTTGLIGGLDSRIKFEVVVSSSTGQTVPADNSPSTLSAMLLREGVDVTSEYGDSCFTWERVSEDREADASWRESPTGKTLTVSYGDLVYDSASFLCRFRYQYSDTMYYTKTGFITISVEVPGPQGEQGKAYVTVVESSNGDVFKPGEAMSTTLYGHVYLNGIEVTNDLPDSSFTWKRISFHERLPPDDDYSWNLSHASGYRQVNITADSIEARATYTLEIHL